MKKRGSHKRAHQDKESKSKKILSEFCMVNELMVIMYNQNGSRRFIEKNRENMDNAQKSLIQSYILLSLYKKNMALKDFMRDFERKLITVVLLLTKGSLRQSSSLLGIKETTLCEKIKRYGIDPKMNILNLVQKEKSL